MNINENKYYTMSGDPTFDNFSPSGFHLECDFEHNYTTKTTAEIFKDGLQNYMPKPHKPNKIEIDGVWYDLVECPIQWEG